MYIQTHTSLVQWIRYPDNKNEVECFVKTLSDNKTWGLWLSSNCLLRSCLWSWLHLTFRLLLALISSFPLFSTQNGGHSFHTLFVFMIIWARSKWMLGELQPTWNATRCLTFNDDDNGCSAREPMVACHPISLDECGVIRMRPTVYCCWKVGCVDGSG